jgi:phage tail protein X
MQDEIRHNVDGTIVEVNCLNFLPFDIFGFIDCLIDRICRPFLEPDGDYVGALRKEQYARMQQAFYTGYKKCRGIKDETMLLPNGISTVFGPVSAHLHDIASVLTMRGLNQFLTRIQRNKQHQCQVMGDGVYRAGFLECV